MYSKSKSSDFDIIVVSALRIDLALLFLLLGVPPPSRSVSPGLSGLLGSHKAVVPFPMVLNESSAIEEDPSCSSIIENPPGVYAR